MISRTKIRLDDNKIKQLCDKAFHGVAVSSIKELTDGWFNASFAVSFADNKMDDVVLKAAPPPGVPILTYENDILRAEVDTMQLLADDPDIPLPTIHFVDYSRSLIESDFYFMSYLCGGPWNKLKADFTDDENAYLEHKLGSIHRKMNANTSTAFGLFTESGQRFKTWFSAFTNLFTMLLKDGERFSVELPERPTIILEHLNDAEQSFLQVLEPRLIHWDLWEGNAFVHRKNGKPEFSGIIDFERSMWGDPVMEYWFSKDTLGNFLQGYGQNPLETPDAKLRRAFYDLYLHTIMIIEDAPRDYDNKKPVERALKAFTEDLCTIRSYL